VPLSHVKIVNASQIYTINRFKNIATDSCVETDIDLFIPVFLLLLLLLILILLLLSLHLFLPTHFRYLISHTHTQTHTFTHTPHTHTHMHTLTHTHTLGERLLDEVSARGRDLYPTKHNTHNTLTFMPTVGFEPVIPAHERAQTNALDRAATGISLFPCLIKLLKPSG
jgi:uncharacterized protein (DUF2342 family)